MTVLKGLMKVINNPYASIADDGLICGDIHGYMNTGIYALNALISGDTRGGYPQGKIVCLAGEKGTGKTFLLLKGLKEHLDADPENEVLFFESEGSLFKKMLQERGLDLTRITIAPITTIEDFRTQAVNALDYLIDKQEETGEFPKLAMCLDSLGMLGTDAELQTAKTGENTADMGRRAQLTKSAFRLITLKMSLLRIPMIVTAHTYKGMGKYNPKKLSGGQGPELAASIIVFLSKTGVKSDKGNAKIKNLVGNNITFILHKGRMTIEGSKMVIGLDFKKGIQRNNGMIPLLIDAGIITKSGSWFSYGEERIGQGEKSVYKVIDTIVTDDVLDDLQPFIEDKFCYGKECVYEKEEKNGEK